jgi:hypothetical protein
MHVVVKSAIGQGFSVKLNLKPNIRVLMVKNLVCQNRNIEPKNVCLVYNKRILNDEEDVNYLPGCGDLSIIPWGLEAAVDEQALMEEYRFLREQFPLVRMIDLMTYKGKLRCERGYVKELANRGVWPFTEYVKWHEFKMVISYLHPYKPPSVTWLTDISHPNIIPHKKGKVCVSILGKKWRPNTKLAAVINALYFLLSDPNPYSAYPTKKCKEVAKIVRMFGFPLRRRVNPASIPSNRRI